MGKLHANYDTVPSGFSSVCGGAGLSDVEVRRIHCVIWATWSVVDEGIQMIESISENERRDLDRNARLRFGAGPYGVWYDSMKSRLNPDAVRYVDHLLAQSG